MILLLLVFLSVISASKIRFSEDIGSFFPNKGDNQRILYAYQHMGADNRLIINIGYTSQEAEGADIELTDVVDALVDRIDNADTAHLIKELFYRVDQEQVMGLTQFVVNNLPYFLTEEDYERMDTLLEPSNIDRQLQNDRMLLSSPMGMMKSLVSSDPMFFSSGVLQRLKEFNAGEQYRSEDDYIFNKEGSEAIVIVSSNYPVSETKNNGRLINLIDEQIVTTEREFDGKVNISCFGASQVSITNASQIKKDSVIAIVLSLILIVALLIYYYRNGKSIFLILLSILFGGIFALGIISLIKHTVSVIAIGAASIILGIAINYPIHFLSHYRRTSDKEQIIRDIVNPLLIGNITTVGAFLSLLFISSDAMKDLGFFAALLLVGTILFVLVFLPHLLRSSYKDGKDLAFKAVAEFKPETKGWIMGVVLLLTVVFYYFSGRTSFETDMHAINYMTEEQRAYFERLNAEVDSTLGKLYCVSEGATLDQALRANERAQQAISRLVQDSAVISVSGVSVFLPSQQEQQRRIKLWNDFWTDRANSYKINLRQGALRNGFNPDAFALADTIISRTYQPQTLSYFEPILQSVAASYVVEEDAHVMVYNMLDVNKSALDRVGKELNKVSPDVFVFDDGSIAARMADALSDDFDYVLYICGFIVFLFLVLSFGRIEIALIAFLPLVVAWVWILGIMGVSGMKFNIVNIILATFIFGMGDDYSIFVTEGTLYEYRTGRKMLAQFKNSIILSASIMFISIGMLIFAKHPAMRSLAEVTIVGMVSVVIMACVIPPFLFNLLTRKKSTPRLIPVTLWNFCKSVFGFTVFIVFSIIVTLSGFILIMVMGRTDSHKLLFHRVICGLFRAMAKCMPQVPYTVNNPNNEDFSSPAVIVCNHQSHFDLLYTLLLSPKIVVLTNEWVWKSPFYGWILRYADYLPIADGIDKNIPRLKALVDKGYSILVFPEGTRSEDCSILRFHQGAFYLANQLELDILPVMLHGVGHILPKKEFHLRKGSVHINILPRIQPSNSSYIAGHSVRETAHLVRELYVCKYKRMVEEIETPDYFRSLVKYNYIYKGVEVQRQCRKTMQPWDAIKAAIDALPDEGRILVRCCGQGELTLLAALVKKRLQIVAFDSVDEHLRIAQNCASVPSNLTYVETLPDEQQFDVILERITDIHKA
ncbi:MAG: 1-acyl-sn-glycerol-3-phosphate acyltransferase [Bacteroidales bacterium]|nr:1-acyl-sn-glycerol-3-phosphate acyltransferase [Bacteroidales bacterium]